MLEEEFESEIRFIWDAHCDDKRRVIQAVAAVVEVKKNGVTQGVIKAVTDVMGAEKNAVLRGDKSFICDLSAGTNRSCYGAS